MRKIYEVLAKKIEDLLQIDARYFLRGGFWLTVGQIFTIIFGIATTSLFAYYLSENDYGIYKYLIGLISIFTAFSLTGLGQSILQATAKGYLGFYREAFKLNAIYAIGIFFSGFIAATYYFINNNIPLAVGCILIALIQPIINQFQLSQAMLNGAKKFKQAITVQIFRTLFTTVASIIVLYLTHNIIILFATYLITQAIVNFVSETYYAPKYTTTTPPEISKKYISYAKHTSVRNIIGLIAQRVDLLVIFTQLGAVELALYSITIIIPEQIRGLLKNLFSLLIQKYAKYENSERMTGALPLRSLQLASILAILTILYIIASPYIYSILFPKYPEAVFLTQLYSLVFVTYIAYIPYSILQVTLSHKKLYLLNIYGSIFRFISSVILIVLMGVSGAIVSEILYRLIFTGIAFLFVIKK